MQKDFFKRLSKLQARLKDLSKGLKPRVGLITGSGLADLVEIAEGLMIPFAKLAGLPLTTVEGHPGQLLISSQIAIWAGRYHLYEGFNADEVVLPVFLLASLGIKRLIITNAAGAINSSYKPGELVLISDHINLTGANPLRGNYPKALGPRFPDMTDCYSLKLRQTARSLMPEVKEGIYAGMLGPRYETRAEIEMLRRMGADLVGMSTVCEVIAARFLGLEVLGLSCVSNMASGLQPQRLTHQEVIEKSSHTAKKIAQLVKELLPAWA